MRPCFRFSARAATATVAAAAVLSIYDEIGFWGVQAADFRAALAAVKEDEIVVEINSPGGDVFAGAAIYNMLKASGKQITSKVMGVAASAASLIAMAGDSIEMPKNTFMMVHNPWGSAMGNADEMRETAELLDKIGGSMLATYQAKTGLPEDELKALLAKDTWMTADEALELGFATSVTEEIKAQASFDMKRADLPEHIRAIYAATAMPPVAPPAPQDPPAPAPAPAASGAEEVEAIRALVAGDPSLAAYADKFAVACASVDAAKVRMGNAKTILALGKHAKQDKLAGELVESDTPVADARTKLLAAMAENDTHTGTEPPTKVVTTGAVKLNPQASFQKREEQRLARRGASTNRR